MQSNTFSEQKHSWNKKYAEYRAGSIWAERKAKFYLNHRRVCTICGAYDEVDLHHLSYYHYNNFGPGQETDKELLPLCGFHHEELDRYKKVRGMSSRNAYIEYQQPKNILKKSIEIITVFNEFKKDKLSNLGETIKVNTEILHKLNVYQHSSYEVEDIESSDLVKLFQDSNMVVGKEQLVSIVDKLVHYYQEIYNWFNRRLLNVRAIVVIDDKEVTVSLKKQKNDLLNHIINIDSPLGQIIAHGKVGANTFSVNEKINTIIIKKILAQRI